MTEMTDVTQVDTGNGYSATLLSRIDPQPPAGIKYMLGGESWMPKDKRSPLRLQCEEWGNLGPMELNPEIKPNAAGFRVRSTTILAPEGALGFAKIGAEYWWIDRDMYGRSDHDIRASAAIDGLAEDPNK